MAKKTVWQGSRDAKELARLAKIGDRFYTIDDVAKNIAPYEDDQLYSEYIVKYMHPLLGGPMICGSLSVERLVLAFGPVHTVKPDRIRGVHEAPPQVAGPLPKGKEHDRDVYTDAYAKEIAAAKKAAEKARKREKVGAGKKASSWW
jgi:hypothetical protein